VPPSAATAADLILQNDDLLLKIFDHLPCALLRVMPCVNKAWRRACDDATLRTRRRVVSVVWSRVSEPGPAFWAPELEWARPALSPPAQGWRFRLCGAGAHLQSCPSRPEARSPEDMAAASHRLGRAVSAALPTARGGGGGGGGGEEDGGPGPDALRAFRGLARHWRDSQSL
jgi:hypothetical protein